MVTGNVILLNGASSSGKSSLASALQGILDEPFWHLSIDHVIAAGILPTPRIKSGEFLWADIRPRFMAGFHQCLPALASAGNNLIVEYVAETRETLHHLLTCLKGLDVFVIGIHCALPELERREEARGDRKIGSARADFAMTHNFMQYDFEVDMTSAQSIDVAATLKRAWTSRSVPGAFIQMSREA